LADTRTYESWRKMRRRCTQTNFIDYPNYGGRGITICASWNDFANFLADMGERPEGHSLDRINNNGNYEPDNCRWATPAQQSANRRPYSEWKYRDTATCTNRLPSTAERRDG
jgi:hypothetical protein